MTRWAWRSLAGEKLHPIITVEKREAELLRMVPIEEWVLSQDIGSERRERLLDPPPAPKLLAAVIEDARSAHAANKIVLCWQEATDSEAPPFSYFRALATIPLCEATFDQLFNGRSGYRAQYYLSPEEGLRFNRMLIDGLEPIVCDAFKQSPLPDVTMDLVINSLRMPHAKIWPYNDCDAFNAASAHGLAPARWVENGGGLGCRAPLPNHTTIDLKGSFINPTTQEFWVHPLKQNRACDLYHRGFS